MPQHPTEQDQPPDSSNHAWVPPLPSVAPHVEFTDRDIEKERRTHYTGNDSVTGATTALRGSRKVNSGLPERSSSLIRRHQTSTLTPMPASAACVDPFATSGVHIDEEMATLLRLYTQVILPRIRFHKTISKACSGLAVLHALQHPMVLYAVLCRASIEPRPEDGDPRDGVLMHQASVNRGGKRESIKFKLQAIKYLNHRIGTAQSADDYLPILHTISFLLRIEVSPFTRYPSS